MAINFPEKYKQELVKGFDNASQTDALFSHELDMEFSGVRTVHIANIQVEDLQDYNRNVDPSTGSRYGTVKEVQDEVQTFEMTQDKSLALSIDKGNKAEQFNWKKASEVMNEEKKRVIVPYLDKYRLNAWAKKAGLAVELPGTGWPKNIVKTIVDAHNTMMEYNVPENVTLVIARKYLPDLKLASEWIGLNDLGSKTLPKGTIAEFDGMPVKPVTTREMPENVAFMILFKGSIIAPMKIKDMKAHVDPPNMSGDLMEFRLIHDAFVIGSKAYGVLIAVAHGKLVAAPTYSPSGSTITFASTTGSAAFHYTTDGTDPRYSKTVQTGASAELEIGQTVKCYATLAGSYDSNLTEFTRTV